MSQDAYAAPSIQASSDAFSDLRNGGLAGILAAVIAANPALSNPSTAPTATATGGGSTGGNLAAGAYFVGYTWTDGAGETLMKEIASAVTIAAGNIPRATIPSLPTGACSANIYLTMAGGASLSETLYATGVTGTTFDMSFAQPTDPGIAPPTKNTTGAAAIASLLPKGNLPAGIDLAFLRADWLISQYLGGAPVDFQATRSELLRFDYALLTWHEAIKEALTLIAANPGTLSWVSTQVQAKQVRRFS